ncbi:MAG: copper-translocating P-type ATPase [Actinobacteria bacterium]|nr:copper-translocating P-type ATPase [Actinomycetota bacterium]
MPTGAPHVDDDRAGDVVETATLHVGGLNFASEKGVVERMLGRRPGVVRVEANPVAQTATVAFDATVTSISDLRRWIEECGYHCAGRSVPNHICDAMEEVASAPLPEGRRREPPLPPTHAIDTAGHVDHTPDEGAASQSPHDAMGHGGHAGMSMDDMVRDMRTRFLVAAVLSIPILLWSRIGRDVLGFTVPAPLGVRDDVFQLILSLPVVFFAGWTFFDGAVRALRARTLDMMVLVAVAVGTGWGYSLVITINGGDGDVFYEAACVLTAFVLLGHWFEMRARGGANDAIRKLLDLAPPAAIVLRDGEAVEVPTAEVVPGDLLLIRPGARVPVDALVEEGEGEVDESMVTGESLPVHKGPGSELIGATINRDGSFRARASRVGSDTALAQIVKLVQEAQNSKAPGQRLADRAAFWLVFVALVGGVGTLVAWMVAGRPLPEAMLFAITVVVVTCPDALGLATPTAIMVGTGLGADRGILFKNAMALEMSARIEVVVMDKTGTLTKGEPEVTDVVTHGIAEDELLRLTAAVERESEHPLAEAVVRRADAGAIPRAKAERFENVPGQGAIGVVETRQVVVGNGRLMEREGIDLDGIDDRRSQMAAGGRSVVILAVDGKAAGLIGIADAVRETAATAVATLTDLGIEVVMLTGDNRATAERIGGMLGVDTVIAEVLPADKAGKIRELQTAGRKVAMVGDGVNDAPALAQADLGIAIGAGTDVAIETADVVLMRSDPLDVATAIHIGRGTLRKMRQNLGWAVGYNAIALPIAAGVFEPAFGLVLRPEIAALSMSGSSFIVAMNALLLKRLPLSSPDDRPAAAGSSARGSSG